MRHLPEKRQKIGPPAGLTPLLLAVAVVIVTLAAVLAFVVTR